MIKELKSRQIAFLFLAFLPLVKFFTLPKSATQIANEDAWISVLICIILDFIAIVSLLYANKKFGTDLSEILEFNLGKIPTKIIYCIYYVYFLSKAFTPIFEQYNFLQTTLYEPAPTSFKYFPFLILAVYLCVLKVRSLGRISDILWPITIISVIGLLLLAVNDIDYGAILPVGANGSKIFKASFYILNWFTDASYLLFLLGNYETEKNSNTKILMGFGAYAVITLLFCIVFYSVFTFVAGRELFAITEISKYSNVLNSIGRFDYMAIFALLIPHTVAVILPLHFATRIINTIFPVKRTVIYSVITCLLVYAPIVWLNPYATAIAEIIHTKLAIVTLILGNIFPAFIILFKKPKENYNEVYAR